MKKSTRKGVACGLLVAAALFFVVAKAEPAAAPAIQATAAGKPRIGGILKFGIVKDIGTPIPFVAYTSISQYVKDNVYEPLVMYDQKGEIHPWLAESWTAERKFERVDVQDSPGGKIPRWQGANRQ